MVAVEQTIVVVWSNDLVVHNFRARACRHFSLPGDTISKQSTLAGNIVDVGQ